MFVVKSNLLELFMFDLGQQQERREKEQKIQKETHPLHKERANHVQLFSPNLP